MNSIGIIIIIILVYVIWNRLDNYYTRNNKPNSSIRDTIFIAIGFAVLFSFFMAINHNEYFEKYSGGYTVEVLGHPSEDIVELYILHKNGKAKWMYLVNTKTVSEKSGSWIASEGKILISIQGNTGLIEEEYVLKNGLFVNSLTSGRILERTK